MRSLNGQGAPEGIRQAVKMRESADYPSFDPREISSSASGVPILLRISWARARISDTESDKAFPNAVIAAFDGGLTLPRANTAW